MTDSLSDFEVTGEATDPMFELLEATDDNVVAIRVGTGTPEGYQELYDLLIEKTKEHGSVHVYEETPNWTLSTYLSHLHGLVPDLRSGPKFNIDRYAAVGDSHWTKLLYYQWEVVAPVWPVAPDKMRYYELSERNRALDWVTTRTPTTEGE